MKIEYVGPKAKISSTGVDFDNNKDDKFKYLNVACQLIDALDHEYIEDKTYVYDSNGKNFNSSETLALIKKYRPDFEKEVDLHVDETKAEIEDDLLRATDNKVLCDEECQVLRKNIMIMKKYNIQRTVNKAIYYILVEILATIMERDHIDYVTVPMLQEYTHVLHSVQGVLTKLKFPIDTDLDIYEKDGEIFATLKVVSITANKPPLF
ncbi:MAG: hypothetical protein U9N42_11490 [Campylobacterota bacterium]|nr:hypothetical protein [Campylobacterota bacterium]